MQPQFARSNVASRYWIGLGALGLALIGLCAQGESVRAREPSLLPVFWSAPVVLAQTEAPQSGAVDLGGGMSPSDQREVYISIWQFALVIGLFLLWVKTASWVNADTQMINLKYAKWNAILFFPFVGAMLLHLLVLPFFIGFSIAALVYVTTFLAYTIVRNRSVPNHLKVFTGSWWRYWFADMAGKLGMKVSAEKKASYEKGAPVDLAAKGGGSDQKEPDPGHDHRDRGDQLGSAKFFQACGASCDQERGSGHDDQ